MLYLSLVDFDQFINCGSSIFFSVVIKEIKRLTLPCHEIDKVEGVRNDTATIHNNQIYEKSKDQNFLKLLLRLDNLLQNIFQQNFEIW